MILTSGEKLDIFPVFSWELNLGGLVGSNQLTPLDDLLAEYGTDTLNAINELDWKSCQVDGKIYGVPANSDKATQAGVLMRKDVVDELNIDHPDSIKTMEDLEEVLMLVKEKKPDMYPLASTFANVGDYNTYDGAGNDFGVLENIFDDSTTFVNYYETDTFKEMDKTRRRWNQTGLIMPDATSNTEDARTLIGSGKAFCGFFRMKPGVVAQESAAMGTELVSAVLYDTRTKTDMVGGKVWAIPANSEKPERAMEVLDLLYNDPEASNLFTNGVEGVHYVYTDDSKQVIDYPEGKEATPSDIRLLAGQVRISRLHRCV